MAMRKARLERLRKSVNDEGVGPGLLFDADTALEVLAEVEALTRAADEARAEGMVEAANYVWFSDDRTAPNMDASEHIRRQLARELREKARALKGKRQ